MKKKLLLVVAFLLAIILVGCVGATKAGGIEVVVYNLESEELVNQQIDFEKGDTLEKLLVAHEEILLKGNLKDSVYEIEEVAGLKADEDSLWIIEIDGVESSSTLNKIKLRDQEKIALRLVGVIIGSITLEVHDQNANKVFSGDLEFTRTNTLVELLENHSEIQMKGSTSEHGFFIEEVCGIKASNFENHFWNFKVNDEDALVGISGINLTDEDKISLHLISWM